MIIVIKKKNYFDRNDVFRHCSFCLTMVTILNSPISMANSTSTQIIHGQVSIDNSVTGITTIKNSPNAIIEWQKFNINENEAVRFIQETSQSAVLNRIIGGNPSQILGQLFSNGKVFLINPNGILFGANSQIDTQSLIASSLNLSNQDFQKGNFYFSTDLNAGDIRNEGIIHTNKDGNILLIAPNIRNDGILKTDGGTITLAAGESLTIANLDNPEILFQVQAPQNSVLNIGKLLTEGGAVNVFAGLIKHSGDINADSIAIDKQGNVQLIASNSITIEKNSKISANHAEEKGSDITIIADGKTEFRGDIQSKGGFTEISGKEELIFDGKVNLSSLNGKNGRLLLDPKDISIQTDAKQKRLLSTVTPESINNVLKTGTEMVLQANNDITISDDIFVNNPTGTGGNFTLEAGHSVNLNAKISTDGGNLALIANHAQTNSIKSTLNDAKITMNSKAFIDANDVSVVMESSRNSASKTGEISLTKITAAKTTIQNEIGNVTLNGDIKTMSDISLSANAILFNGANLNSAADLSLKATLGINTISPSIINATNTLTLQNEGKNVEGNDLILSGQNLNLLSSTLSNFDLSNVNNQFSTLAANFTGNLNYKNNSSLILSDVFTTGTIDIATETGDLTVMKSVVTTNTSPLALKLNANELATTEKFGDILIENNAIVSVGEGGIGQLLTGSIENSTGVTSLVGKGSEHFRYNSDETHFGYTSPLTHGIYAIYREQPLITIKANSASKIYDDAPYFGGNGIVSSGYVNGDTASILENGHYGGSAQNAQNAGVYDLTVNDYKNGFGYAIDYESNHLTIDPEPLKNPAMPDANLVVTEPTISNVEIKPFADKVAEFFSGRKPDEVKKMVEEVDNNVMAQSKSILVLSPLHNTSKNDEKDDKKRHTIIVVTTNKPDTEKTTSLRQCQ